MLNEQLNASVAILTFNSERYLDKCLASVAAFEEILILDGGSTDGTLEIARCYGARILPQSDTPGPIDDFTAVRRRSFALAKHEWVFWIDSDEYANEELILDIRNALRAVEPAVYSASKIPVVEGREIYYAYNLPNTAIRLIRKGNAEWRSGKKVHEHLQPKAGIETKLLQGHVFSHWESVEEQKKKDLRYIHLAFNKPVLKRPGFLRTLKSIIKNICYAGRILCMSLYLSVMYRHTGRVLPFRHHARYMYHHLRIVRERIRQFVLAEKYVPPKG